MTRTEAAAFYGKAIATQSGVDRKGASILYTSLNGHMFSMFTKDGRMALRLPEPAREAFLRKYKTIWAARAAAAAPGILAGGS